MSDENADSFGAARRLYQRGVAYFGEGLLEQAEAAYRESLALEPRAQAAWFNLGLVYKRLRRWPEALRCSQTAARLDPNDKAAWWNTGIAATAIRDWPTARQAWRAHGLEIPDGSGPPELNYGQVPIRLNPDGGGEVVWCRRIDPARAIILSIPLPDSGHRWGDSVLHDGEPRGERVVGESRYYVFDELERWEASATPTLRVEIRADRPEDSEALTAMFESSGLAAEDWTTSLRRLCRACSQGAPHEHEARGGGWSAQREFGLAADPAQADLLLLRWATEARGRAYGRPALAL